MRPVRVGGRAAGAAETGMVTAETAVGLGAVVVVLLGLLWAVAVVVLQVRCTDAARDAARAAARGEPAAASRAAAHRSAPSAAAVQVFRRGDVVTVDVAADARPPWPVLRRLPAIRVHGRAQVAVEPGEPATAGPAAAAGRRG